MTKTIKPRLSRRLILGAAVTAVGIALSGCGGDSSPASGGDVELNFVYWGDANRAKMTDAALRVFEDKNPGITVKSEYQDSGPYADKLATRFAGGNQIGRAHV